MAYIDDSLAIVPHILEAEIRIPHYGSVTAMKTFVHIFAHPFVLVDDNFEKFIEIVCKRLFSRKGIVG